MKAALYSGDRRLEIVTKELRPLGEHEVLIDVEACGICGTDLHIVEGTSRSNPPVIIGHEYAGRIVECGSGVKDHAIGERVAVDPNIACGECLYCRRGLVHLCTSLRALGVDIDGGMAEYSIVPSAQIFALGAGMSAETCAFVEPVSCAVHGIDRARINAGDVVVIIGGGPIGQIMLQLALTAGAASTILVEPVAAKRELGTVHGASYVIDPGSVEVAEAVHAVVPEGADVVIDCAGTTATAALSLTLARRGGTVEFFGVCPIGATIPVEPNMVYFRELTIVGSYVNPFTFSRAIALLRSGKVRVDSLPLIRFPLEEVHEALRQQRDGTAVKSILIP
jgi:2-desacetyl-2-hydroxyethyl bacteriochlorophyllide A dehydrogenase